MIDKNMFPKEYAAIERLKKYSRIYENERAKRGKAKQAEIDKWRRKFDEEDSIRRNSGGLDQGDGSNGMR